MRNARSAALFAGDNSNGRICDNFTVEGRRIDHIDVSFEVKQLRDQFAQRPAVAVLHPAIRANKSEPAAIGEQLQRALDERDIKIGTVEDRAIARPVFAHQHVGDQLLPDVRRIADDEIKFAIKVLKQEVSAVQPCACQLRRLRRCQSCLPQPLNDFPACALERRLVQLGRGDRVQERVALKRYAMPSCRFDQTIQRGQ